MKNWLIYLKERFPLPVYFLLVGGMSLSGSVLATDTGTGTATGDLASSTVDWGGLVLSFFGLLLFFAVLRLMDELKDYQKDVLAHPERPLPRGLLGTEQVARVIQMAMLGMVMFGILLGFMISWAPGGLYLFLSAYLWLMFKEFYLGSALAARPILYAITHQVVLLPMCLFTVATVSPEQTFSLMPLAYGFAVLGAFFTYEVCRKLDPKAHPVLKTYLAMYGPGGVALLVAVLTGVAARAAVELELQWWLWPLELLVLISLSVLFFRPERYKLAETAATLSLLFHIWAVTFRMWLAAWGVL
ncbi:MAG: hypothetical protein NDI61_02345 [Bdellovibrionaceae bacterium]|nr:hypothetical protein [Pseudobdellovibrionaceae bacterium]